MIENTHMSQFKGTYLESPSAPPLSVNICLGEHSIILRYYDESASKEIQKEWPFASLETNSPLAAPVPAPALLMCSRDEGSRLVVRQPEFIIQLLERAPHLSQRAALRRLLFPFAGLAVFIIAVTSSIWFFDIDVFKPIAKALPQEMRTEVGRAVIAGLIGDKPICKDPEGIAALGKIQTRLMQGVDRKTEFTVTVAKLGMVNAFAAPGEQLVITAELIEQADSPEEIAGILAHEMGHGLELHADSGIVRSLGLTIVISIIFGSDSGGLASAGLNLLELQHSRAKEREADLIALDILRKAQVSPNALLKFHEKLDKNSDAPLALKQIGNLLSTHPASPERIAMIRSQPKWASRPILTDKEWQELQGICR